MSFAPPLLRPRLDRLRAVRFARFRPDSAHGRGPAGKLRLRFKLNLVEQYVLTRTLVGVFGALGVLGTIVMLIDFVELSRTVGNKTHSGTLGDIFELTLLRWPSEVIQLLPFAFLFGVLAAYVNLNRRSELVALRAAGVSAWRFVFPAAGAAVVVGIITILALNPIASLMADGYTKVFEKANAIPGYNPHKAVWMRQGDRHSQVIIRAENQVGSGVDLKDVTVFLYKLDSNGVTHFTRRIDAAEARLQGKTWKLTGVKEATPGGQALHVDSMSLHSTLSARVALEKFSSAQAVPFWSLPFLIARTERAGFSATLYRMQFDSLLATPVMYAGMSVLAAAFSLRLLRLGGLAAFAGSGVGLGFILFFFNQFCNALGKSEIIPPFLAAWAPPLIALLGGFTLLCYTEDG
jgi:lipopolysaccharide export system permease protein